MGWPDFQKVFTENISSRSMLVFVTGAPPKVGELVELKIPSNDGSTSEHEGKVVRVEPDSAEGGRTGVAIELLAQGGGIAEAGGREPPRRQAEPITRKVPPPVPADALSRPPSAGGRPLGPGGAVRPGVLGRPPSAGAAAPGALGRPPSAGVAGSGALGRPPSAGVTAPGALGRPPSAAVAGPGALGRPASAGARPQLAGAVQEGAARRRAESGPHPRPPAGPAVAPQADEELQFFTVPRRGAPGEGQPEPQPGAPRARPEQREQSQARALPRQGPPARSSGSQARVLPPPQLGAPEGRAARPGLAAEAPEASSFKQIGVKPGQGPRLGPAVIGNAEAPVVGIDFGTTYSKVAVYADGEVLLVEDTASKASSRAAVPSQVAFLADGGVLVGEPAREILAKDPSSVLTSIKRVMGLSFRDPLANGLLGSLSCPSHAGPNDTIVFDVAGREVTVPEVCARILEHLRDLASRSIGARVKKAIFTAPVDFDARSKRELELAARMANLEIVGLVPEPVAAAMGCGFDGTGQAFVTVFDFGGGTCDASIVEVGQNRFAVRGSAGDRWLGGDDFDEVMARHVADEYLHSSGINLHNRAEEWQRLLFASEEAKRWLSTLSSVDVVLPEAAQGPAGPQTLLVPMTRATFEEISADIIASSLEVARAASVKAQVHPRKTDVLLITGGSSRIPAVKAAVEQFFGKKAIEGIHPEHAVVIGAAVRAAVLSNRNVPEDLSARLRGQGTVGRDLGLALAGGTTEHIIRASQRPPNAAHRIYSTHRDGQTTIRIQLVEGPSSRTEENRSVGGFVIEGLPARPAGAISLDVYFELSTTGTLYVTAQERSTGQRAQGTFDLHLS